MKIDFDEEKHEYRINGQKVPSVSEILAPLSAERYRELNPAVLAQAAARGTAVHEICEAIDYGLDAEIDPVLVGYVTAYQAFLRDYFPKWEMIEQIVPCYGYQLIDGPTPIVWYCGTIDRYGIIDGKEAVVDIKTYASVNTDSMISASCQTALYSMALESMEKDPRKRYLLHLKKDGDYRLIDLNKFDTERGFCSFDTAWRLYEVWHDVEAARKAKKKGKKKDE